MRPLLDMDTIQIEITNHCHNRCSNCTRLVGHHARPYFMAMDAFKRAVDSMVRYPKMTGVMGGEPLLHPQFVEICDYLHGKIPPERCGLWTCFPDGYEHYREVIVRTFGHIFLNDHTRTDVLHTPILVYPSELQIPKWQQDYLIHHCWVQNSWSATINPHGAFFCEIAGAISMLLQAQWGWDLETESHEPWWTRPTWEFTQQIENFCRLCGGAMPLKKRYSVEGVDDVGPGWKQRLAALRSPKAKAGKVVDCDLTLCNDPRQTATYKDQAYRDVIADRYGMFLMGNRMGFLTPYLRKRWKGKTVTSTNNQQPMEGAANEKRK